ncbi:uncharacterized protein LOC114268865 [Camellia sinensis]|uniref:uncharacterized protein LOC114268865 n=1 Tax=Camellia sinensis TaxID=4442 RepID=UPI001035B8E1|nr:uncharacterized protein LOC114268865 [Camellia sinensis]
MNQNSEAASTWIAKKLVDSFKDNPHMELDTMKVKLNKLFEIDVSRMQLYRAKRRCKEEFEGDHGSQYVLLPTYVKEIKKTNLGSLAVINYDLRPTLISKDGEELDRVNGSHLKGSYSGVLISAVVLDGNNGLFPLALAVVEGECKTGLDKIVSDTIPEATHRRCCMHLFNNFRAKLPGLILRKQFWKAVRTYNEREYDQPMQSIKEISNDAFTWLQKVTIEGRVLQQLVRKYEIPTNSIHVGEHKVQVDRVEYAGGHEYEVKDNEGANHIVHLGMMTCMCREWEISRVPCKHAVAAISHSRLTLEDFFHPYYSKKNYLRANDGLIHLILDHTMWTLIPRDPLQSPPLKRLPRRPRNSRKRVAHEPLAGTSQSKRSCTLRYKLCTQFGGNKRTCQRGPVRGEANGSGTSASRGSGTSSGRVSGTIVDRGRSSVRGTSTRKGTSIGKGTSTWRGHSTGREQSSEKGSSTGRGRGKGKAKHAHWNVVIEQT